MTIDLRNFFYQVETSAIELLEVYKVYIYMS